MLSLQSEIDSLCAVSHELLHLGLDGEAHLAGSAPDHPDITC